MHSTPSLSLIFPMAGQGRRFGFQFKPFLKYKDETFIGAALRPFLVWKERIAMVYFIYLEDQEAAHGVSRELRKIASSFPFKCVTLETPTRGPAETVSRALATERITGPLLICDCDHSIEIAPLMEAIASEPDVDCIIPTWDLEGENVESWSVASIDPQGYVTSLREKALPEGEGRKEGVIGCYYFRSAQDVQDVCVQQQVSYISGIIQDLLQNGKPVKSVRIANAAFFGDPDRLEGALKQ